MRTQSPGEGGVVTASHPGALCAVSAQVMSARAATPRVSEPASAACCDDDDCAPGQCPTPCRGKCACLVLHGSPLTTTTPPTFVALVAPGIARPISRTDLAPHLVSREPALRPPIA